jgi:hypothetical protein
MISTRMLNCCVKDYLLFKTRAYNSYIPSIVKWTLADLNITEGTFGVRGMSEVCFYFTSRFVIEEFSDEKL